MASPDYIASMKALLADRDDTPIDPALMNSRANTPTESQIGRTRSRSVLEDDDDASNSDVHNQPDGGEAVKLFTLHDAREFKRAKKLSPQSDADTETFMNVSRPLLHTSNSLLRQASCPLEHVYMSYVATLQVRDMLTSMIAEQE